MIRLFEHELDAEKRPSITYTNLIAADCASARITESSYNLKDSFSMIENGISLGANFEVIRQSGNLNGTVQEFQLSTPPLWKILVEHPLRRLEEQILRWKAPLSINNLRSIIKL